VRVVEYAPGMLVTLAERVKFFSAHSGIESFSAGSKIDLAKSLIEARFVIKEAFCRFVLLFFSFLLYFFILLIRLALWLCLSKPLAPIVISQ